jgi:predicted ATPase
VTTAGAGPSWKRAATRSPWWSWPNFRSGRRSVVPPYLHQAAENTASRYAPREVIDLLTRALVLLRQLPATAERLQQELAIQLALGPAWVAMQGYGAPEVMHAYSRARVLCQQLGDTSQLFPVLYGLWSVARLGVALQTAQDLAEELFHLAQSSHDPACLLIAHSAIVLWLLGTPDQALTRVYDAFPLAQELAHPPSLAYVLSIVAGVHQLRREPQAVREQAEAMAALSTAHGFAFYLATSTIYQGAVLATQGQHAEALGQMHQGLAARQATGAVMAWRPYFLTRLAEASAQAGQPEEGERLLAEAQTVLETTGERWWEAEVHRLRGELLWRHVMPEVSQVETCFLQALAVARCQQAKSLELRAAMSLARLWQQQGKRQAAHTLLAEVYHWFSEGLETADLQEARALLAALS